jgi:hypothetical protein
VSRRAHNLFRLVLSGMAALFAYTVVITSRPAVTPAVAAPDRAPGPKAAPQPGQTESWKAGPVAPLADPRQRLLQFGR